MEGIKETALELLQKFKGTIGNLDKAEKAIKGSRLRIENARFWVSKIPITPLTITTRHALGAKLSDMDKDMRGLEAGLKKRQADKTRVWGSLKKFLDFFKIKTENLGITFVAPILAVGALALSAGFFWRTVVNETREINLEARQTKLAAEGKLTAEQITALRKQEPKTGGGFMSQLTKPLILISAIMILPGLLKAGRGA